MTANASALHELEHWKQRGRAAAEARLPGLLELPPAAMSRDLARDSVLRAGVIQVLLPRLRESLPLLPGRVLQLTAVLVEQGELDVIPSLEPAARYAVGQVWTAHAAALHVLQRLAEARRAVATALQLFRRKPDSLWYLATAEVVEAEVLYDLGHIPAALRQIRGAARAILDFGNRQRYVQARMSEAWMHCTAGDLPAAGEVWRSLAEEALQRGDRILEAHIANAIGVYELRRGSTEAAARHFETAHEAFRATGNPRDAVHALRNFAEARVARGQLHAAISDYHVVRDQLLRAGDILGAARAAIEILDLHILAGREDQIPTLATKVLTGTAAGALLARAESGHLTRDDIAAVRAWLHQLPLRPNAPFPHEVLR
jgi:tetratricopeptide (TPR) repeat protein